MKTAATVIAFLVLAPALQVASFPPSGQATPFSHILVVMQENHSFDNYFGTYPTANGTLVDNITSRLEPVNGLSGHICLTYSGGCISPRYTNSTRLENPLEGQSVYENDYGPDSNFVTSSGPQSMVYFDYHSIPAYWDYAEDYGIADNYFAAVLSETTPNRLMLLTGNSPVASNYGPPPFASYNASVLSQLTTAGQSWGYYDLINKSTDPSSVYPLDYLSGLGRASSDIRNVSTLVQELKTGSGLPSVSFVSFLGDFSLSEHPPYSPGAGQVRVVSIVNDLMKSSYWNSTVVFITWDEGGGFFDHVAPPRNFAVNHNFTKPLQGLGQRVPLLVISPYSRINYVSHVELSHLSILHFIEFNWNIPPINKMVNEAGLPLDFFDFSQAPRSPLLLGGAVGSKLEYPIPLQEPSRPSSSPGAPKSFVQTISGSILYAATIGVAGAAYLLARQRRQKASPSTLALIDTTQDHDRGLCPVAFEDD